MGPGPSGNSLEARVEDSGGSYTTLSVDEPTSFQGRIGVGTQTANSGSMPVDWIAVRPAVGPEPTVGSWGSEQTPQAVSPGEEGLLTGRSGRTSRTGLSGRSGCRPQPGCPGGSS